MMDNTVTLDQSVNPPAIKTSPVFNVAVPFIDRHLSEGRGDKVVYYTADGNVTFADLAEQVNRSGNVFTSLGAQPGDRILMVVKDCPEFLYLFFGAIKAGYVPVPVNTMFAAGDYTYLIEDSGCKILVYSPEFAEAVEAGLAGAKTKPEVVLRSVGEGSVAELTASASPQLEPAKAGPEDDCFWLYSSGSTGHPKGVVHSHKAILYSSQGSGVDFIGLEEDDICFSASKMFHSYGFGNVLTFPLYIGCSAVLTDRRVSPDMTFEIIEQFKPTVFFGVPTLYAQQLEYLSSHPSNVSSLRRCVSAGEALPGDVFNRWKDKTGTLIIEVYGSTEVLHGVIANTPEAQKAGSSGKVVNRYEARLVDDDGNPVEQGELGTVHIKGGSIAKYYWNNPEKTAATMLPDGWLSMGDNSYQDEDGWFFFGGRGDDMLKIGGLWCSPFEIEARLIEHAAVLEAAVVGRKDENDLI
ncbi:MAG: benzoate-CoA ligase family protein, partial [Rhodospirillaceae bacterium]|nr:benzoate-CoA ligase family protein [Rhodospirillaceae bacterium]